MNIDEAIQTIRPATTQLSALILPPSRVLSDVTANNSHDATIFSLCAFYSIMIIEFMGVMLT